MLQDWSQLLAPAVQERICLLLNHVISRETLAMAKLKPHAGRAVVVHLAGWPALLPRAPDLVLAITPAGLLERQEVSPAEAMRIEVDASNPAAMALAALSGERPRVSVQGDAALAGDLNWLIEHLRWDVADDLAKIVGPAPAHQLVRWGGAIASGLAVLARSAASLVPGGRAGA
ncbi:hypothetical protein RQP53_18855 [Paucibacter sp. APW11]|uniref:SCP2 domain-containing protein n=1 Tax=Roseateles aquae TaxID=3077235 RepID=A0ABU3PG92_9BURK|nr:hypothetical protein [Paucibacter sp. APW11]MDT9001347.1 hypothetical protein [Paucibacter sp. APW11]